MHTRLTFAGIAIVAVSYGLSRYTYGLFVPEIRADLGVSLEAIGLIASGSYVGYLLATLITSVITARVGPRLPVLLGGFFAALGMFIVSVAEDVWLLALGVFLAGTSPGWAYTPFSDATVRLIPEEKQNKTYAFVNSGTCFGVLVGGPVALLAGNNWQTAWMIFAILAMGATILNLTVLPSGAHFFRKSSTLLGFNRGWLFSRNSMPLFTFAFIMGITTSAYWTFAVDHIERANSSMGGIGAIFWVFVGISGLLGAFAGDLSKRFGLHLALRVTSISLAISIALLSAFPAFWPVILGSGIVFGVGFITITALLGVWSMHLFNERPSLGFGTTFFLISLGQLIGPVLFAAIASYSSLSVAFYMAATVTVAISALRPHRDIHTITPLTSKGDSNYKSIEHSVENKGSLDLLANDSGIKFKPISKSRDPLLREISKSMKKYVTNPQEVYTCQNAAKYVGESSREVFDLMKNLNQYGINNQEVGITEGNQFSLRDLILHTTESIKDNLNGRPFHYIELEPEPVKTKFILENLIHKNLNLKSYTAVDINPSSYPVMKSVICNFLPENEIFFHEKNFDGINSSFFDSSLNPEHPRLITMLGFEEGNMHPANLIKFVKNILRPGDFLLSEMQILSAKDWSPIFDFYKTYDMENFSKITLKKAFPDFTSEYGVLLLPVTFQKLGGAMISVTLEKLVEPQTLADKLFITNYFYVLSHHMYPVLNLRRVSTCWWSDGP